MLPPDDSADGFDNNADLLGVSPALLERYLVAAARISELAVNSPAVVPGSETYRIRGDASQSEQNDELSPGTRGGLLATHTFPLDGEYVIKVKLLQTNLASIRGIEYEHQFEITLDGERVLLAPVGGPDQYVRSGLNATEVANEIEARLQVRVKARAGQRAVGAAFLRRPPVFGGNRLQPFLRTTLIATDHLGFPHVESMTVSGPFNAEPASETPSRRADIYLSPTASARAWRLRVGLKGSRLTQPARTTNLLVRRGSSGRSRGARTGATSPRPISPGPLWLLPAGPQRGRIRTRHRVRALRAILRQSRSSSSASSAIPPGSSPEPFTASATSSWRRGCRSSSGAASRTTTC